MKEATGEVSMTVITIVLLALLVGLGTWLFAGENAPAKKWITGLFEQQIGEYDNGIESNPAMGH